MSVNVIILQVVCWKEVNNRSLSLSTNCQQTHATRVLPTHWTHITAAHWGWEKKSIHLTIVIT